MTGNVTQWDLDALFAVGRAQVCNGPGLPYHEGRRQINDWSHRGTNLAGVATTNGTELLWASPLQP